MKKVFLPVVSALFIVVFFSAANNQQAPQLEANNNEKVTICHRTGNGSSHNITVSINAVPAHLAHGDAIGDCRPGNE